MSGVIAWFVHNPVAANLLMFLMVTGGLLTLPTIRQEEFPAIETDVAQISVEYPGASPAEIEDSICLRIEEEIDGTPDIKRINTRAVEGACVVTVELVVDSNVDATINEIESRINAIDTFPIDAEKPVISKFIMKRQVLVRHLEDHGCHLLREGDRHSIYANPANRQTSSVPRHREINDFLARKICRDLGVSDP